MSQGTFRFKQFEVGHARSSMRVGTDAVLLGAWTSVGKCSGEAGIRILDIGCGCGLIALMLAQRSPAADVLGIDIDAPSIEEATENAQASPFASRVRFLQADVRSFARDCYESSRFSLIVCNPPYYTEDTLPPEARRSIARNAAHLGFAELLGAVCLLLDKDGTFSVVIPMQAREQFVAEAVLRQLYLRRECRVHTVVRKEPKRILMEFGKGQGSPVNVETLVLQDADGSRTAEYAALCEAFYL